MLFKYKGGYGGNYTLKWLISLYGFKKALSIYVDQEFKKLKHVFKKGFPK